MKKLLDSIRRAELTASGCGRIYIGSRLTTLLGIQQGDVVNVAEEHGEYYLFVQHSAGEDSAKYRGVCFRSSSRGGGMLLSNTRLARELMRAAGMKGRRAGFPCGDPVERGGITYIPIITKLAIWK